jgi:hypothetical protein
MNRNRLVFAAAVAVIILFIILGVVVLRFVSRRTGTNAPPTVVRRGRVLPGAPGPLPEMSAKPQPVEINFQGCPAEGDNPRQADLNRLKNRVDEGEYVPVAFESVANLSWPKTVERQASRDRWSAADRAAVEHYEGVPVAVEGYLAGARQEGPESPNCHGDDPQFRDFHIWLVKNAADDRSSSIVVEATPRVRANHPKWTTDLLGQIVRKDLRVRVSGWLMLDPEHPDQVGKTRGTIWEIHPIMQIEVQRSGAWVPLDDFGG